MITEKQRDLLKFYTEHLDKFGYGPSYEEIAQGLGLKAKSGVHRLIVSLEARGLIKRQKHVARSVKISENPNSLELDGQILSEQEIALVREYRSKSNAISSIVSNLVNP